MAVEPGDLADYVGAEPNGDYEQLLIAALGEAVAMVDEWVGAATVPVTIRDWAVKETASDLFYRRNAPGGVVNQQFTSLGDTGDSVRIRRDPMAGVYPVLRRYVLPWKQVPTS